MAVMLLWLMPGWAAEDLLQEQSWARQLQRDVPASQQLWLGKEDQRFFALYLPATQTVAGGVILLHDAGGHPDRGIIASLRRRFPSDGWSSLALQLPIPESNATPNDYPPLLEAAYARIAAGIEHLHANKISNIVIIGYGLGAWTAVNFLTTQTKSRDDIAGLAVISLPIWTGLNPILDTTASLAALNLPRLDAYGQMDLPEVTRHAKARREAARQADADSAKADTPSFSVHSAREQALARRQYGASGYRQRVIAGADHAYGQQTSALYTTLNGWLHAYWRALPRNPVDAANTNKSGE